MSNVYCNLKVILKKKLKAQPMEKFLIKGTKSFSKIYFVFPNKVRPFSVLYWTPGPKVTPLPIWKVGFAAKPNITRQIVAFGWSRCRCQIVDAWNRKKIKLPKSNIPTLFWETTDWEDDDVLKLDGEPLEYATRMKADFYGVPKKDLQHEAVEALKVPYFSVK
jgi:hypothetical protein